MSTTRRNPVKSSAIPFRALLAACVLLCAAAAPFTQAQAAQSCSSAIKDSAISGDVLVDGQCSIEGSRIDGSLIIKPGARLLIKDSAVLGVVQGDKVKNLEIIDTRLDKGLVITGSVDSVRLKGSSIVGAPAVLSGARSMELIDSTIRESLTLKDGSRTLSLMDSSITNGLSCNRPMTYRAVNSVVRGTINC